MVLLLSANVVCGRVVKHFPAAWESAAWSYFRGEAFSEGHSLGRTAGRSAVSPHLERRTTHPKYRHRITYFEVTMARRLLWRRRYEPWTFSRCVGKIGENFVEGSGVGWVRGGRGRFRRGPGGRRPRERRAAADPRPRRPLAFLRALSRAANPAGPAGRRPQIARQLLPTDAPSAPQNIILTFILTCYCRRYKT